MKRDSIRSFWLASLILVVPLGVLADPGGNVHFERVGSAGGPPPDVITVVYQDRAGFVWIGARDGLTLFDGHQFRVFEHDPADPTSISDNAIRVIYEDRQGNLWIGTNTGGLNRLDRATWKFEHFRHDSADSGSLSHDSVYSVLEDESGVLWVGTQRGLNHFDPASGVFARFLADPVSPDSLADDYVYTIYEDREDRVWVGTLASGLHLWHPRTRTFTRYRHDPNDPRTLLDDSIFAITEDSAGTLWVGTSTGLNRMNRANRSFERFAGGETGLSDALVTSLAPGTDGTLWVGTHGGGLNELDTETLTFKTHLADPRRRDSLGDNRVITLFPDRSGALWIGTWGGGLHRLAPSSQIFSTLSPRAPVPDGLVDDDVTSLMHDRRGGVWAGTRSGDLVRLDPAGGTSRFYLHGGREGTPRIVLGLLEDSDGHVWVGTSGGLVGIDPESGKTREWTHDPRDPESIGPGYVRALYQDRPGSLWVGTGEGGLNHLDTEGRVLERFLHDPGDPTSLSDDYVTLIREGRDGRLWVGTRSGGLNSFDTRTGKAVRFIPDRVADWAISHHYVTTVLEDSRGRVWVGTGGGGLNRVIGNLENGPVRFDRLTTDHGLIDDDVMAILEDDDGTLWLSTKRGLSRFDPTTGTFASFNVEDGLPSGEFEPGAAVRTGNVLYFGSVNWVVAIPSGTVLPEPETSPTVITSIRTGTGDVRGDRPVWEMEHLEIPWGEWFSIELAVLDFHSDHNHSYLYRLGDRREEWIDLGARRAITFTNLDPGVYPFHVRGRNCRGVWSAAGPALTLEIVPPFWMTRWFRGAAVLFVIGMAVVVHRVRTAALEKRNRELLRLHESREKARQELGRAYERLRLLTRRLEVAKEEERQRIARELHDEMGPALTAVIITLQLLSKDPDPVKTTRKIEDTIELVDRMIQRIHDLSLDLRPPLLDELGLLPALTGYMESQSERSGIEIEVEGDTAVKGLGPELEITAFRVAQEAVTNVIRHAGATRATVNVRRRGDGLEISITDNGRGFDVEAALERAASGKSLGLLGIQERIGTLGGDVDIDSAPGRGTTIRVRMPTEVAA
jgi:signal transduction histidine kinase/ligand-binding sensor domain-containing protein